MLQILTPDQYIYAMAYKTTELLHDLTSLEVDETILFYIRNRVSCNRRCLLDPV